MQRVLEDRANGQEIRWQMQRQGTCLSFPKQPGRLLPTDRRSHADIFRLGRRCRVGIAEMAQGASMLGAPWSFDRASCQSQLHVLQTGVSRLPRHPHRHISHRQIQGDVVIGGAFGISNTHTSPAPSLDITACFPDIDRCFLVEACSFRVLG